MPETITKFRSKAALIQWRRLSPPRESGRVRASQSRWQIPMLGMAAAHARHHVAFEHTNRDDRRDLLRWAVCES